MANSAAGVFPPISVPTRHLICARASRPSPARLPPNHPRAPGHQIRRQPGEMDEVTDIVVGDVFTNCNFRHRLRFSHRELFEPDRGACDRLYDNGVRCFSILILVNEFAGSATGHGGNSRLKSDDVVLAGVLGWLHQLVSQHRQQPVSLDGDL